MQTFDSVRVDILEWGGGEGKVREKHWIRTLGPSLNAIQYKERTKKRRKRHRRSKCVSLFEERYLEDQCRFERWILGPSLNAIQYEGRTKKGRKRHRQSNCVSSFEESYLEDQCRFERWIKS